MLCLVVDGGTMGTVFAMCRSVAPYEDGPRSVAIIVGSGFRKEEIIVIPADRLIRRAVDGVERSFVEASCGSHACDGCTVSIRDSRLPASQTVYRVVPYPELRSPDWLPLRPPVRPATAGNPRPDLEWPGLQAVILIGIERIVDDDSLPDGARVAVRHRIAVLVEDIEHTRWDVCGDRYDPAADNRLTEVLGRLRRLEVRSCCVGNGRQLTASRDYLDLEPEPEACLEALRRRLEEFQIAPVAAAL